MTGRSLHDALLRVLTSADLRRRLDAPDEPVPVLGPAETAVLRGADRERLGRLARFLGRHFYRERIVRLFAVSRLLAREGGEDPLGVLDTPEFAELLASAEVGSPATAERVAELTERRLRDLLPRAPYTGDLVYYEGALFRAEAGPRRWDTGPRPAQAAPIRSPHGRVITLDWDVTPLVTAARRGERELPEPRPGPVRLLIALSPRGQVTTVRCRDIVAAFLDALDGHRSPEAAAQAAGLAAADVEGLLRQLAEIGAVEWTPRAP